MSYNEIAKLRDLFAQDTLGLVSSNQRLILTMMISHESTAKGCIVGLQRLQELTLLKKRALLQNLHYLGDGKSWKNNSYTDCTNPKCRVHLKIVKTDHYAKKGWQQVYRTELKAYEHALRVHVGAPIKLDRVHVDDLKGAPQYPIECTQAHPLRLERHERQLQSSCVDLVQSLVYKLLPNNKQFILDQQTQDLCLELEHLETPFNAFTEYLSPMSQDWINNPSAYVKSRLLALKEATPALVAERKALDEKDRELRQQLQDMESNKVTGELLDEKIKLARKAIGQ